MSADTQARRRLNLSRALSFQVVRNADELAELSVMLPERYILLETAAERYGSDLWVTLHPTIEAAARYRDGQECPEDWPEAALIDLDNPGHKFYVEVITRFWRVVPA